MREAINTQTCERSIDHSAEITHVLGYGGVLRHQSHVKKKGGGMGGRFLYGRDVMSRILSSHMQGRDYSPGWNIVFYVPRVDG